MKFIFITVCYHNAKVTLEAIKSFKSKTCANSLIIVVDNSNDNHAYKFLKNKTTLLVNVKLIKTKKNLGYFKGLNVGLKFLYKNFKSLNDKIVFVGNNDIIFKNKIKVSYFKNINSKLFPVISPRIRRPNGIDLNPYKLKAYNYFLKVRIHNYISKFFISFLLMRFFYKYKLFKKKQTKKNLKPCEIFLGHGTLYILLPTFFKYFKFLPSQSFLWGEELLLTLMLLKKNKKIYFDPKILIKTQSNIAMGTSINNKQNYLQYKLFKMYCHSTLKFIKKNKNFK